MSTSRFACASWRRAALTLVCAFAFAGALHAQATGLIVGVVQDGSGAVIPGANVLAVNELTGIEFNAASDAAGRFSFPRLPVGEYRVEVSSEGFRRFSSGRFRLDADQNRRVTATLELGEVTETVTVEGAVTQVDTETATLKEIVDERRITELPLNGRNPIQLILLVPGVNSGPGGVISQNQAFSVNGARAISNNYMLDGGDNNDVQGGSPAIVPNPDALEEFSIQTNNFSAEHGSAMGGVINAVTKSGTNQFHGSAYDFLRNDVLDAASFDANRSGSAVDKGKLRRNQYGATVGGPVIRNKTFFFFSFEGVRTRQAAAAFHNVATDLERSADFSLSRNQPNDPATSALFPNAVIPQTRWDPVAPNYLDALIPHANLITPRSDGTVFGRIAFNSPNNPDRDQYMGRMDHQITQNQRATFRIFTNTDNTSSASNVPTLTQNEGFDNWNIQGSHTWTISPNLLGVGRITWNQTKSARAGDPVMFDGQIADYSTLGVNTVRAAPVTPEEQAVTWRGSVTGFWNLNQVNVLNTDRQTYQAVYDMSWTRGAHMLKFGGEYRWSKSDRLTNNRVDPQFQFNGNRTTNGLGDFFLGLPSRFQMGSQRLNRIRNIGTNFYVQDDWKIKPNLTINLGLRFEPYHLFYSADDELSVFVPGQQSTQFPNAPTGALYVGDAGVPRSGAPTDWNNLAPRIGMAWQPFGNGKTAIRAAYGIFYDMPPFHEMSQFVNNPPFSMQFDRPQVELNEAGATLSEPFIGAVNPFPFTPPQSEQEKRDFVFVEPVLFGQSVDPNLVAGYNQQWNINVQQELPGNIVWTTAYIGSKAQKLPLVTDRNLRPAESTGLPNVRPYAAFSSLRQYQSVAFGSYHAFQTTINKRMSKGFTVLANYTFSKTIDISAQEGEPATPQNVDAIGNDKALADFHHAQRLVASFLWAIPTPFTSGVGKWVLGGWQANGIYSIQSGNPVNTITGQDIARTGQSGGQRPDLVGDPLSGVSRDRQAIINGDPWYNVAAFANPARGYFGGAGRNIIIGPSNWNMDFGLFKNIAVGERINVQYRWEMFNALNHANLNDPNGNINAGTAAEINTLSGPRIMQMGLRVTF